MDLSKLFRWRSRVKTGSPSVTGGGIETLASHVSDINAHPDYLKKGSAVPTGQEELAIARHETDVIGHAKHYLRRNEALRTKTEYNAAKAADYVQMTNNYMSGTPTPHVVTAYVLSQILEEYAGYDKLKEMVKHKENVAVGDGSNIIYVGTDGYVRVSDKTIGSHTNPVFLNAGTITASTASVGSTVRPIFMDHGDLVEFTGNIAANNQLMYMNGGDLVASEADVGEQTSTTFKPVYLKKGVISGASGAVGSSTKPIYMQDGKLTATGENIGAANQLIYMLAGNLTASTTTIGSVSKPVYVDSGVIKECTLNTSSTKLIYFEAGEVKESTSTVGGTRTPIWLNGGTFTAFTGTTGTTVKPVYISNGVLTECVELAPKLAPSLARTDDGGKTEADVPTSPTPTSADPDTMIATKQYADNKETSVNYVGTTAGPLIGTLTFTKGSGTETQTVRIHAGTSGETIIETISVPLLMPMWFDHLTYGDVSWVPALNDEDLTEANMYSGTEYTRIFKHLKDEWELLEEEDYKTDTYKIGNGTGSSISIKYKLAADGHKICEKDQITKLNTIYNDSNIGTAWYIVLDTTAQTFHLPRTRYGFHGNRSYVKNPQVGEESMMLFFFAGVDISPSNKMNKVKEGVDTFTATAVEGNVATYQKDNGQVEDSGHGIVKDGVTEKDTDLVTVKNLSGKLALKAPLESPALTGTPTAPTATDTTTGTAQIATLAFVITRITNWWKNIYENTAVTLSKLWTFNAGIATNTATVSNVKDAIAVAADANGKLITASFDTIPTKDSKNLMTSGSIKNALDGKADIISGGVENNIVTIDGVGNIKDSGKKIGELYEHSHGQISYDGKVTMRDEPVDTDPVSYSYLLSYITNWWADICSKAISFASTLTVGGKITANGGLDVANEKDTTVGNLTVGKNIDSGKKNLTVNGTMTVTGATSLSGSLTVDNQQATQLGATTIGTSESTKELAVNGPLTVLQSQTTTLGTTVIGLPASQKSLTVNGSLSTTSAKITSITDASALCTDSAGNIQAKTVDTSPSSGSSNLITSGAVDYAINNHSHGQIDKDGNVTMQETPEDSDPTNVSWVKSYISTWWTAICNAAVAFNDTLSAKGKISSEAEIESSVSMTAPDLITSNVKSADALCTDADGKITKKDVDTVATQNATDLITSGAVYQVKIDAQIPINGCYISTDNTDPSTTLGYGTWELIAEIGAIAYIWKRTT